VILYLVSSVVFIWSSTMTQQSLSSSLMDMMPYFLCIVVDYFVLRERISSLPFLLAGHPLSTMTYHLRGDPKVEHLGGC
jgi:hypothetical protein